MTASSTAMSTAPLAQTVSSPTFRLKSVWIPVVILVLAFAIRIAWLGIKPPHFDEGVNGWFVDLMTTQGFYHYDPGNFHGPLHFYVLFLFQTLFGRDVWILRLPTVLVSTGCVALMLAFSRFFDRNTCRLAALAMAVSPGMIFYGRYAIHETWLLFFLLLTTWGILGLWKNGSRTALWSVVLGITGMVLTKETYIIHVVSLLLAFPTLWILEQMSPSAPAPWSRQQWNSRDLRHAILIGGGLILLFYTGAFLDWPDFSRDPGTVGSLAGLWETFGKWAATGTQGDSGHEKPWPYWLDLLTRYEWPAAAGLVTVPIILRRGTNRLLRYLMIAGLGTLTAYSIVAYKTPWCLIVIMWPFLLFVGHTLIRGARSVDRWVAGTVGTILFAGSFLVAERLNFKSYTDENEPYVYVQTLPDINQLINPLYTLARINPANYHIRGYVLLPESDSHPLPWMLAEFPRVAFLNSTMPPPSDMAADFILAEDAIVSDLEEHLQAAYFKDPFILRGSWGNSATLYLKAATFAPLMPGRTPEFEPQQVKATSKSPPEDSNEDLGLSSTTPLTTEPSDLQNSEPLPPAVP